MEQFYNKNQEMLPDYALHSIRDYGYALPPSFLSTESCQRLRESYCRPDLYRKPIEMQRYRFGQGEYKYFQYPLPEVIQKLRNDLYVSLAGVASEWTKNLNTGLSYPDKHEQFLTMCKEKNQTGQPRLSYIMNAEDSIRCIRICMAKYIFLSR